MEDYYFALLGLLALFVLYACLHDRMGGNKAQAVLQTNVPGGDNVVRRPSPLEPATSGWNPTMLSLEEVNRRDGAELKSWTANSVPHNLDDPPPYPGQAKFQGTSNLNHNFLNPMECQCNSGHRTSSASFCETETPCCALKSSFKESKRPICATTTFQRVTEITSHKTTKSGHKTSNSELRTTLSRTAQSPGFTSRPMRCETPPPGYPGVVAET